MINFKMPYKYFLSLFFNHLTSEIDSGPHDFFLISTFVFVLFHTLYFFYVKIKTVVTNKKYNLT